MKNLIKRYLESDELFYDDKQFILNLITAYKKTNQSIGSKEDETFLVSSKFVKWDNSVRKTVITNRGEKVLKSMLINALNK